MAIFADLAKQEDEGLRAFGLAGECETLSLRKEYRESNAAYGQLLKIIGKLKNRQMADLVGEAVARNRAVLGPETAKEWEELKGHFHDGG